MKDGSIGKISENRFARADLEHVLLMVDDDMRMEALRQTNYVKSIVTAQGKMDLERKGKQSYQGWMFVRLLAFSNGDLQALYDRSDGFYRRQLVLTTKEKSAGRVDDPDLAEKMKAEAEGIFLWAFEGLRRLDGNNFKFTESNRIRENREAVKRDNNNIFDFMESEGYIRRKADASISSKDFYEIYRMWCEENSVAPLKARSFSDAMIANADKYNLEHCNNVTNSTGRRVWGFMGVEAVARPHINGFYDIPPCTYRKAGKIEPGTYVRSDWVRIAPLQNFSGTALKSGIQNQGWWKSERNIRIHRRISRNRDARNRKPISWKCGVFHYFHPNPTNP